jgi:hypothetical protein
MVTYKEYCQKVRSEKREHAALEYYRTHRCDLTAIAAFKAGYDVACFSENEYPIWAPFADCLPIEKNLCWVIDSTGHKYVCSWTGDAEAWKTYGIVYWRPAPKSFKEYRELSKKTK